MSPSDLGHWLKPFVFLDLVDDAAMQPGAMPLHPHSGLATLTYMIEGAVNYEDTTGKSGRLPSGGVEWMMAGGGVWHTGGPATAGRIRGFQLWVALPPELENAPAHSEYLDPKELPQAGPVRVLLGSHDGRSSPIAHPAPVTYLGVQLKAGESWRYEPPRGQTVAWLAVSQGRLRVPDSVAAGEMIVFEESNQAIDILAEKETQFVLGSAEKHPHELALGYYSVHTSQQALRQGEAGIRSIGAHLGDRRRAFF
jgi:redox-sensitive bicupin YhaK (pirin superfamily)